MIVLNHVCGVRIAIHHVHIGVGIVGRGGGIVISVQAVISARPRIQRTQRVQRVVCTIAKKSYFVRLLISFAQVDRIQALDFVTIGLELALCSFQTKELNATIGRRRVFPIQVVAIVRRGCRRAG
jgi:hypothetical protein